MSDLPLTSAQLGLFFAHELAPDNPCYTTAEVVELAGPVDADVLREAHRRAYAEHEQVRVELAVAPDGPRQRVTELIEGQVPEVALPVVDVAGEQAAEAWLRDDLAVPMRLTGGDPLVRSALLRLPDGRCWWYHAAHHLVADGYAAQQLLRRIAEHHDAIVEQRAPRAEPGAVLADVVAEDAARDDTAATSAWQERLAGMTGVVALAGRTSSPAARARRAVVPLDEEAQTALVQGARRLGVGWTDLVTAAVGAYLARMAGRDATRIGLPLMNRAVPGVGQLAAARTVCTATNVLPLTIPGRGTVADVLAAVAAGQREVREHPFVRQEALQRMLAREHPGAQLFGAQLNLIPFDLEISLGEVAGAVRNLTAGPVEDMTIGLRGTPGRGRAVRLELDAHPDLYDAGELAAHLARLRSWLVALAGAEPDLPVEALPLATPDELRMIDGFNATAHPHDAATLAQRFVRQAEATPEAPALVFAGATRTYGELLDRSRRIAGGLRERGVGPGDVVGVRLPRGLGLYETIHAVQLLGAVYLPLDPDLPEARLAAMCEDADVALVVTDPARPAPPMTRAGGVADARRAPSMPSRRGLNEVAFAITRPGRRGTGQAFPLEELAAAEPVADVFADPAAPAYLLFTSGSTGRPKGVLVGHAAIDNRLAWMQHYFRLAPGERVLHKTPISFDVSVWELFWPLQAGGCVVIAEPGAHRDPRRLAELVVEERVTTLHFVPSMLRAFLADRVSRERVRSGVVRSLVCSGEALTPDLVAGCVEWFGVAPTNLYGPTEAAVDVTVWDCSPDDERAVPIGRPVWNTTCHVLDPGGRPVPIGVVGELWLGGVQLAEGYVGRPDLTAERFVDVPGLGRLYRTGDLAAWRPDGALRYLGRTDDQVKVRGQRIELGEIEAAVAGTDGADAVAAGVVDGRLVVWFVPAPGVGADEVVGGLRARAASALPEGWMPSHYVPVAAMPLGTSGKTDRARLAELAPPDTGAAAGAEAPSTLVEQQLCAIFGEVLGGSPLAPDADFFSSGGDSLGVLRLLGRVEDDLGVELGLADVFAAPTPAGLAALVSGGSAGGEAWTRSSPCAPPGTATARRCSCSRPPAAWAGATRACSAPCRPTCPSTPSRRPGSPPARPPLSTTSRPSPATSWPRSGPWSAPAGSTSPAGRWAGWPRTPSPPSPARTTRTSAPCCCSTPIPPSSGSTSPSPPSRRRCAASCGWAASRDSCPTTPTVPPSSTAPSWWTCCAPAAPPSPPCRPTSSPAASPASSTPPGSCAAPGTRSSTATSMSSSRPPAGGDLAGGDRLVVVHEGGGAPPRRRRHPRRSRTPPRGRPGGRRPRGPAGLRVTDVLASRA
nr:non-ribosomal peptide synthetase [Nocardioides humi]